MKTVYQTEGTCCRQIELEVDGDVVKSVRFWAVATEIFRALPGWSKG